ncbi:MAG: VanW family protein [Nocardioidaceae bacterium]|nr:VanW family protein [Nocardioidaceae bacterium]
MRLWPRKKLYLDNLSKTHDLRFAVGFIVALVVLFGALYGVGYYVAGNKVPQGTTVAGVDIGGMQTGEARTALQERLAPRLERAIKATAVERTLSINPQRAGLVFDIEATVEAGLGGGSWDPRHMLKVLLGGDEVDPVVIVDNAELEAALQPIDDLVDRKPVSATVSFASGQPEVTFARPGRALDFAASRDRLVAALVAGEDTVVLPTRNVDPAITSAEAATFVDTVAAQAVSAPVIVRVADAEVSLEPEQFAPALRVEQAADKLRLDIDHDALYVRTRGAIRARPNSPSSARIGFRNGSPVVIPSRKGVTVTAQDWAGAVLAAASEAGSNRVSRAQPTPAEPSVTTRQVRRLGVNEPVASSSAQFPTSIAFADIERAARQLNGTTLLPGGSMSFLNQVEAPRSRDAASFLASTTYSAAFFAGLTIAERAPNLHYSDRFPVGMDARVEPGRLDLMLRNDSPYGVYVRSYVERGQSSVGSLAEGVVHVEMWSTKLWQVSAETSARTNLVLPQTQVLTSPACTPREGIAGFDVEVTRIYARSGQMVRSDPTQTRYVPLDAVVCG